jgi:hypothetical protein
MKTTQDRFSLQELKENHHFDFSDYDRIGDDPELADFDYFVVGYNPHYQLITVDGIHEKHSHTILYFEDALENYHIQYIE